MTEVAALSPASEGLGVRNALAMLVLVIMWGLSIPLTKLGLAEIPPLTFTALRFLVAVLLLVLLSARQLHLPRKAVPSILGLGVMGITLGNVAQSFGVQGTSASAATIISATIPLFIVIFASLRLKQAVTARQWIGLVAAFAGIALVAVGTSSETVVTSRTTVSGVAWMLLSAVAIAFYYIWSAELTARYGTLPVAAWNALAGLVAIVPLAGWEASRLPVHITAQALWICAYLGAMVTVAGLLLWLYLLRSVPARIAASVQYLQPVIGIGLSALLFGDRLGLLFAGGVVLILGGLSLAVARAGRSSSRPPAKPCDAAAPSPH